MDNYLIGESDKETEEQEAEEREAEEREAEETYGEEQLEASVPYEFDERDDYVRSDDSNDEDSEDSEEKKDAFDPTKPVSRVAIDWVELEGALENNSPELHSFLNKITGDVIRVFRGSEDSDQRMRAMDEDPDYLYVEPISSREQYRWMEEFIEATEDFNVKDKLNIAIDGKGAFRRFKDVLLAYPEERERWFIKRSIKLRAHISEWLKAKYIEPINIPPWDQEGGRVVTETDHFEVHKDDKPKESTVQTMDLRKIAHELIDMVPFRELNTAVAFLEFLRSRRGIRRSRYN